VILVSSKDFASQRDNICTVLCHLNEGSQEDSLARHTAVRQLLLDHLELDRIALSWVLSNEVAKFRQNVASNLDQSLMQARCSHDVKHFESGILLQVLVRLSLSVPITRDHLRNSEPELLVNVVAGKLNKLDNHIDVPTKVDCEFLSQNSYLEHHHLHDFVIVFLQVVKEFVDNFACHILIAKVENGVQCSLPN